MVHSPLILAAGSMLDVAPHDMIKAAGNAGFDGVGLRASGEQRVLDPAQFTDHAGELGVRIHDVEVYRIGAPQETLQALIDQAVAVGAGRLLIVSDLADLGATHRGVEEAVTRCRDAGVVAAIEYMAWTTPNTTADAVEIAQSTGCVVVVDLLHHCRLGAGGSELRTIVEAGVLGWVQICDGPASAPPDLLHEARHGRLAPGDGALPLAALLAELPEGVPISVEVQNDDISRLMPPDRRAQFLYDRTARILTDPR